MGNWIQDESLNPFSLYFLNICLAILKYLPDKMKHVKGDETYEYKCIGSCGCSEVL